MLKVIQWEMIKIKYFAHPIVPPLCVRHQRTYRCTNTSTLSLCPRACTAVEFRPTVDGVGTCWRRANVVLDECVKSSSTPGSKSYTLYLRHNHTECPPSPSPAPYPPPPPVPPASGGRNVLYIVYDDLRPDLSAYDVPFMKTPNIQKLADTGVTFTRAYVQEAVCSPSRNSFTTGRRPNSTKVRSTDSMLCWPVHNSICL